MQVSSRYTYATTCMHRMKKKCWRVIFNYYQNIHYFSVIDSIAEMYVIKFGKSCFYNLYHLCGVIIWIAYEWNSNFSKNCENDILIEHLMFVKCVEGRAGYKQIPVKVISASPDTQLVRLYTCTDTQIYRHLFGYIDIYTPIQIKIYTHLFRHRYTHIFTS